MHEYRFQIYAPFEIVAYTLASMDTVTVKEADQLHTLAVLPEGGALLARPTWPNITEIIVAEADGDLLAR